jgi:hypothetical protein
MKEKNQPSKLNRAGQVLCVTGVVTVFAGFIFAFIFHGFPAYVVFGGCCAVLVGVIVLFFSQSKQERSGPASPLLKVLLAFVLFCIVVDIIITGNFGKSVSQTFRSAAGKPAAPTDPASQPNAATAPQKE